MPGMLQTGGAIDECLRDEIVREVVTGKLRIRDACARYQVSQESLVAWVAAFRRSSLLTFDAHLSQILVHQGIDASHITAAEFTGNLGEITIPDLIQTFVLARRDGQISVSHDGRESHIWLERGEIIDAQSGKLVGAPAVHRVLTLERGSVIATLTTVHRPRSVHISTTALLLDGVRRSDEYHAARNRLGAGFYQLGGKAMSADTQLSERKFELLRHFELPTRIPDALVESELGDLETLTLLSHLVAQEYLLPVGESSLGPQPRLTPGGPSNPPIVMSLAAQAAGPTHAGRDRRGLRVAVGLTLGLLAAAGWFLPKQLASEGSRTPALPSPSATTLAPFEPLGAAATGNLGSAPGLDAPRDARAGARDAASAATPASSGDNSGAEPAEPAAQQDRTVPSARRRAARGRSAATAASATAPRPATPAHAAKALHELPSMLIIEEPLPKMQIVE